MKTFTYKCIKIQQSPESEPFYSLSCSASEILKWADVPRTKSEIMAGYQRELEDRHEKITDFFNEDLSNNIIPSSIIISLKKGMFEEVEMSDGVVELKIKPQELDLMDFAKSYLKELEDRLSPSELASIHMTDDTILDTENNGESIDEVPPESYLAGITSILRDFVEEKPSIETSQKDAITEYLKSMIKPGLILDGQHRVNGAKNVSECDIHLPVTLLPNLSHQEQVFHFYVLNNKAKPLSKTKLRTIISTSLGKSEIEALYDRFKQAGVTAEQAEWTHKMNTDDESPFKGLINFGIEGGAGIIPENVAYQVVCKFINMPKTYKLLYDAVEEWEGVNKYDYRLSMFFCFWNAIKDKYQIAWNNAVTGTTNRQILQKVNLLVLMDFILANWDAAMPRAIARSEPSPLSGESLIRQEVQTTLHFLKEEFFIKDWKRKGLDTGPGHKLFKNSISTAISNKGKNLGNIAIFKEGNA
jgi:hypothetical protein